MDDRITLTGLRVFGYHGVLDQEKIDGQDFITDVTIWLDVGKAVLSDDVRDTVHYGQVAELVASILAGESRNLIETVAADIADSLLTDEKVAAVEVTVHKPFAPIPLLFDDVSVTVKRQRYRKRQSQKHEQGQKQGPQERVR